MCFKWKLNVSHLDRRTKSNTMKYVSLIFVLMLLLHGVIVTSVAIWLQVDNAQACGNTRKYVIPIHLLLTSGLLAIVTCKACAVHSCCVKSGGFVRLFFVFLAFVLVLEIVSFIYAAVQRSHLNSPDFKNELEKHSSKITDKTVKCWTNIQEKYQCCGVDNYEDWTSRNTSSELQSILNSCNCDINAVDNCVNVTGSYYYSNGCTGSVQADLTSALKAVQATASVCASFQLIAYIVLYFVLSKLNRNAVIEVYKDKPTDMRMSTTSISQNLRNAW